MLKKYKEKRQKENLPVLAIEQWRDIKLKIRDIYSGVLKELIFNREWYWIQHFVTDID